MSVVFKGFLQHRGYFFKFWSRKYIVLYSTKTLKIFGDEKSFENKKRPDNTIDFASATILPSDKLLGKDHTFQISLPNKQYYFQAESVENREIWVSEISKLIDKESAEFVTQTFKGEKVKDVFPKLKDEEIDDWTDLKEEKKSDKKKDNKIVMEEIIDEEKLPEKKKVVIENNSNNNDSGEFNLDEESKKLIDDTNNAREMYLDKTKKLSEKDFSKDRVLYLYYKYKSFDVQFNEEYDVTVDYIGTCGISAFCKDLKVDPEDIRMIVLGWNFQSKNFGEYHKDEFVNFFSDKKIDTIIKIKNFFDEMSKQLKDQKTFDKIYNWVFDYVKDGEQKQVPISMIIVLLNLFLPNGKHIKQLCNFFSSNSKITSLRKDEWLCVLKFTREINQYYSNYKSNDAWPLIFDDFIEWSQNGGENESGDEYESSYDDDL